MPFFRDDELTLHYLERGHGEPLLLIHGLGGSGADWAFQVAALERRFRVIVPDLPGSGHSTPPRGDYSIAGFADALWKLMDHLHITRTNLVGFSLGGAVALEMATSRPACVPRLGLINSLATYQPRDLRKFLETYVSAGLVRLFGMPRTACLMASRLFPEPWQQTIREHAARVLGDVPANAYLATGMALAQWAILDRLDRISGRVMLIAAERDFTPLSEKRELASRLHAELVIVRGSRHGTPFDSVELTNTCLLALLTDSALPPSAQWVSDTPARVQALSLSGSIAEEHAWSPLLLD
jgi:pimeloyl-ACP methyl ester carboxylesterase